jgi:hypothetical protein
LVVGRLTLHIRGIEVGTADCLIGVNAGIDITPVRFTSSQIALILE